jgi:hypothetical protein
MAFLTFCRKLTQSLTISIALFAAVGALTVFLFPVLFPTVRPDFSHRLARIPLLIVASGALSILCAAIARKAGWSAGACRALPGITIYAACIVLAIFVPSARSFQFLAFCGLGWPIGMLCGKLVYPDSYRVRSAVRSPEYITSVKLNS